MAGINGIGSTYNDYYGKIASGNRINSAADDASAEDESEASKRSKFTKILK